MATSITPNQIKHQRGFYSLKLDATVASGAINTGDLCYWTGSGIASFGASLTQTATLVGNLIKRVGVSRDTNPLSGGISTALQSFGVDFDGTFGFNGTSGDTYAQFDEVTIGADAQTVVKCSTLVQSAPTATGGGSTGTWTAAAHTVQVAIVSKAGMSLASATASVTPTSGQYITVTPAAALPSWALCFAVFVDGILAGYQYNNSATNYLGPATGEAKPIPTTDALAIGYVDIPTTPGAPASIAYSATPPPSGIAGGQIPVRYYPYNGLRNGLN